ncbi:MAG TPA: efflux RND transporter permease subunit [Steroidobacteraceae bacterium]
MNFTDIFIRRPVLATVISLLIVVLGLRSLFNLSVSQYPLTENGQVSIETTYYGADAQTVAGFITQPLEQAVAQAQGIDYLSSSSVSGQSSITATLRLNYDSYKALSEINTLVGSVKNRLPPQSQQPVVTVGENRGGALIYMGFHSAIIPNNGVTDYVTRIVQPKLNSIPGVKDVNVFGGRTFALRAWLDAARMAAHGVTASDVNTALTNNNFLAAIGSTKGQMVTVDLTAATDLHTVEEFKQLAVKQSGATIVRLQDVADVTLGSEDYDTVATFNGNQWVFVAVSAAPNANVLQVADGVRAVMPDLIAQLPTGIEGGIVYDATTFVQTSINEVIKTLIEALLIVTAVIYLFLGNLRSVIIPVVTMPVSLVGTFLIMLMLGYSINLLTLLALVLAIGLVVDDAIIVVENVDRHIKEENASPLDAALRAARELGGPIIAMVIVLVAVYTPIGFQTGLTGALFSQFAFTVAAAVAISGVVALTLSPMMCAHMIRTGPGTGGFAAYVDRIFERVRHRYQRWLKAVLDTWAVPVVMGVLLLGGLVYLYSTSNSELAPDEDQGILFMQIQGEPNATSQQMRAYGEQVDEIAKQIPEGVVMFQLQGFGGINSSFGGLLLKPWGQRPSAEKIQQGWQEKLSQIAGANIATFSLPSLPGASGLPVSFVIKTSESFDDLAAVASEVVQKAKATGMFYYVDQDLKIDKPQASVVVDRDKISTLGLTEADVGAALSSALGGGYVNYFSIAGRSYKVIPQVQQVDRLNPADVLNVYIRAANGTMVPASTVTHIENKIVPESLNRFQQLNSATIQGVIAPSVSLGQALSFLRDATAKAAPSGYSVDYAGQSRQYMNESGGYAVTLLFALLIVFLALAAQYESFRDPIIILVSVPMALFGALIFINVGLGTLNIYTEVGLVTLMGLISKHGILIVQFANELQRKGATKRAAIEEATSVRLRPILMTTAAMVLGVVPLVIAGGAGAAGRHAMGLVIFTGLSIGTLFTLFVVPAYYMLLGADHHAEARANKAAQA